MTDRELMQQALEALNHVNVQDRVQIITALRERLAQPVQEPVGEVLDERGAVDWISFVPPAGTPLYTSPQPAQEPVAVVRLDAYNNYAPHWINQGYPKGTLLYTAPQPRQWVGLTDAEVDDLQSGLSASHSDVRAIEAKLREKNA